MTDDYTKYSTEQLTSKLDNTERWVKCYTDLAEAFNRRAQRATSLEEMESLAESYKSNYDVAQVMMDRARAIKKVLESRKSDSLYERQKASLEHQRDDAKAQVSRTTEKMKDLPFSSKVRLELLYARDLAKARHRDASRRLSVLEAERRQEQTPKYDVVLTDSRNRTIVYTTYKHEALAKVRAGQVRKALPSLKKVEVVPVRNTI